MIQKMIHYVVVVIGFVFVLRGLGLGIPYISSEPVLLNAASQVQTCH